MTNEENGLVVDVIMLLIEKFFRNTADIQFTKLCKISQEDAGNLKGTISGRESELGVIHVELSFKLKYTRIAPSQKKSGKLHTHSDSLSKPRPGVERGQSMLPLLT